MNLRDILIPPKFTIRAKFDDGVLLRITIPIGIKVVV